MMCIHQGALLTPLLFDPKCKYLIDGEYYVWIKYLNPGYNPPHNTVKMLI